MRAVYHVEMTLKLKPRRLRWADGSAAANDYSVFEDEQKIGRIYRTRGGEAWTWTVYGIAVHNAPPSGREPTREKAVEAFEAAWATCEPRERGA